MADFTSLGINAISEHWFDAMHCRYSVNWAVDKFILVVLGVFIPILQSWLQTFNTIVLFLQCGYEGGDCLVEGNDDEVYKSWLLLRNTCGQTITQHAQWQSLRLLNITLLEELFKKVVCPFFRNFKWPRLMRDIACMEYKIHNLLLILEQSYFIDVF